MPNSAMGLGIQIFSLNVEATPISIPFNTEIQYDWTSPSDGAYFVRIYPPGSETPGNNSEYEISIEKVRRIYSPGVIIST